MVRSRRGTASPAVVQESAETNPYPVLIVLAALAAAGVQMLLGLGSASRGSW